MKKIEALTWFDFYSTTSPQKILDEKIKEINNSNLLKEEKEKLIQKSCNAAQECIGVIIKGINKL